MEIVRATVNDKKAIFNATQAGQNLKDIAGSVITVTGIVQYKETNEEGEKFITSFITKEGEAYGSVSANVADAVDALIATFGDITPENPIKAVKGKSKNDREFLSIVVV